MKLKKGDILYCKKKLLGIFTKSKFYEVHRVIVYGPECGSIDVITSRNSIFCFTIEKDDYLYIYNYFYTKSQLRKQKLKRLYQNDRKYKL